MRTFIIAAVAALFTFPASAQSFTDIMAAQTVLKRLGHYESKVDGRMGPGTRKAVSAYAAANGVGDSFLAVSSHIWGRRDWRTEVTDELEAAFYDALDDTLLDAESEAETEVTPQAETEAAAPEADAKPEAAPEAAPEQPAPAPAGQTWY